MQQHHDAPIAVLRVSPTLPLYDANGENQLTVFAHELGHAYLKVVLGNDAFENLENMNAKNNPDVPGIEKCGNSCGEYLASEMGKMIISELGKNWSNLRSPLEVGEQDQMLANQLRESVNDGGGTGSDFEAFEDAISKM